MKSKKRLLPALMVFVVAFCCVLLAGCTRNPADIEILSGEIVCEVNDKDIQPDWSSIKAKVTFEDGTQETVNGEDLVFSHVDVSTVGQKTVQVGYKEGSFRKDIVVYVVESTTIEATVNAYNGTYDGASHLAVDVQGTLPGDTIMYKLEGSSTWVQTCPQIKDAGETTVMVKITREHCPDFETTVKATVAKKSLTIKGKTYTKTYGEEIPTTFTYDIEGFVGSDDASVLTKLPTATAKIEDGDYKDDTKKLKAGRYTVSFDGAEAKNYSIGYQNGTLIIEKASYDMSQVRWSDKTIEYQEGVEKEVILLNIPKGVTATYTGNKATNIGDYTATAELHYDSDNYNTPRLPDGVALTHNWSIAENVNYIKVNMPTANTTVFTYNGQNQTYLPNGFDSDKMYISNNNVQKNANEAGYTVTVSLKEGYAWANANVGEGRKALTFTFVINKLTAQLSWGETTFYYTGEEQAPTCTVTNICSGDTCNVTISGSATDANANNEGVLYNADARYTATATELDNGNYKLPDGDNSTQFDIRKAENSWITTPSIEVSTVEGSLTPTYTGRANFGYDIVKRYYKVSTAVDSEYLETLPTKDGEYIMKSVIDGTDNYTGLESICTFYISKAGVVSMYSYLLAERNSNLNVESENFEDKTRPIFAGQQNHFDFQMIGNVDGESGLKEIVGFSTTIKAYIKNEDSSYTELDSTSLSTYISKIDTFNNNVEFNSSAIGKTFKFEITKAGTPSKITIEVQVVDGYNVYTADDLCVINNRVDESHNEVRGWESKKAGTKYADLTVNSIVLQKDINIADSNIPSEFFYTAGEASGIPSGLTNLSIEDSMKDGDDAGLGDKNERAIYERNVAEGQTFSIYGNYFTIDYSKLTRCIVESGNEKAITTDDNGTNETLITTHATVFKFNGLDSTEGKTGENAGTVNFFDLRIIGNGERSNRSLYSGGIMAGKLFHINSNVTNSIYKNTFIGFLVSDACANGSQTTTTFLNTKGYDCYNTLIYSYGVSNFTIKGGEYLRAGGPVMIVDHVGGNKVNGSGGIPSNITVIGAKMESFVTGNEPWFVGYGATALIPQITARNKNYVDNGSTFLVKENSISNLMNLKVVYKSSSAEGLTAQPVRGKVEFYDSQEEYDAYIKGEVTTKKYGLNMTSYSTQSSSSNSNLFENSYNGGILGATTYLLVPNQPDNNSFYVVKFANIMAFQSAALEEKQKYIEGNVTGKSLTWVNDPKNPVTAPDTTLMQLDEKTTLPSFTIETLSTSFATLNTDGSTHINGYMFNGMGIVLELFNKDRLNG